MCNTVVERTMFLRLSLSGCTLDTTIKTPRRELRSRSVSAKESWCRNNGNCPNSLGTTTWLLSSSRPSSPRSSQLCIRRHHPQSQLCSSLAIPAKIQHKSAGPVHVARRLDACTKWRVRLNTMPGICWSTNFRLCLVSITFKAPDNISRILTKKHRQLWRSGLP